MNIWDKAGLTNDGKDSVQTYCGYLYKSNDTTIQKIKFRYSLESDDDYDVTSSMIPGFEYALPRATIRTTRTDIPFNRNDSVELQDGTIRTIRDISIRNDSNRNIFKKPETSYVLTLEGGKP